MVMTGYGMEAAVSDMMKCVQLIAVQAVMPPNAVKYSGNVLATQRGSLIRTGTGPNAASEKAIAMRWSS